MFKVHYPSKRHLKKQLRAYGSDDFYRTWLDTGLLLKSALLHFRHADAPADDLGLHHTWAPPESINEDLHTPDHPPWSHDPRTNELLEGGHHPIDYVHMDLQRRYNLPPETAASIIDDAIGRYNEKHPEDTNHGLPNFDDPQWRKTFVGDYIDPKTPAHMRQIRGETPLFEGGPRPLITYSMNMGNVDHPGADTGAWIDGGHVHFHNELGDVLEGYGAKDAKSLPYVKWSVLKPNYLSGGHVKSWSKTDAAKAGVSGSIPLNFQHPELLESMAAQRAHGEAHAHQVAKLLPDGFYHAPTGGSGGNAVALDLRGKLQLAGIPDEKYSDEELEAVAGTRAMKLLFQRTHNLETPYGKAKGESGGAVKGLAFDLFNEMGSHYSDDMYQMHKENIHPAENKLGFQQSANHTATHFIAHLSNTAHKLMDQGMDEDSAKAEAVRRMRESSVERGRFAHQEGLRELSESVIDDMMQHTESEPFTLGSIPTDIDQHRVQTGLPQGFGETHTEMPEHWQKRIVPTSGMAPVGNSIQGTEDLAPPPTARTQDPTPPPTRAELDRLANELAGISPSAARPTQGPSPPVIVAPAPAAAPPPTWPTRSAVPIEEEYMQQMGLPPSQRFFDIGTGAMVQRSNDVIGSLDDIRKQMEMVQIMDAKQDPSVIKMLPNESLSISSFWDVQTMAKSLGITGVDVHGLYQSQGDWHRVAKQWNVSPEVVKVVKVAFGGE